MGNTPSRSKQGRTAVEGVSSAGSRRMEREIPSGEEGSTRRIVGVLISYTWRPQGQLFPICEGRNFVGRADISNEAVPRPCDIQIPQDTQMSAEHALILCRQGNYEIIDQETTNGTFVNGTLLKANLSVELPNYAKVRTGATEWTFIKVDAPQGGEGLAPSGSLPEPTEKKAPRNPTLVR